MLHNMTIDMAKVPKYLVFSIIRHFRCGWAVNRTRFRAEKAYRGTAYDLSKYMLDERPIVPIDFGYSTCQPCLCHCAINGHCNRLHRDAKFDNQIYNYDPIAT